MITIGITGGIGSGKSEVCRVWKSLGAFILDSDELAKSLMQSDSALKKNIIDLFGEESYLSDGSLNRPFLAQQAFANKRVTELNKLVHDSLWKHSRQIRQDVREKGYSVFVQEAAIFMNNPDIADEFDYLVLVEAPEKERIDRVIERSSLTRQEVLDRIEMQKATVEKLPLFDFTLINDSTLEDLAIKAQQLYREILRKQPEARRS